MKKQIISLITIIFSLISFHTHASEQNWKPAQDGDKIILIRHALAPGRGDPKGFKIDDCKTQRNLDMIGINQSKKIGKLFKENKNKAIYTYIYIYIYIYIVFYVFGVLIKCIKTKNQQNSTQEFS